MFVSEFGPLMSNAWNDYPDNAVGDGVHLGPNPHGYIVEGTPPSIFTQPTDQKVNETSDATFMVSAQGSAPLSYQWHFQGTNIPGATDSSLTLHNVQYSDAGLYSVQVTNSFGSVLSSNALLGVNRFPVALCTNVIVSAGSNCVADASVDNGSYDPDGDTITLIQIPSAPYPKGTNVVTLTATDAMGALSSCSALVIVVDSTPPSVICPQSKEIEFTDEHGATTTFTVSASDTCSTPSLVVTPPSGSLFPIGVTTVLAQATDASSNTASCNFTVTVLGALGVAENVLSELITLRAALSGSNSACLKKLDLAIQRLSDSVNPTNWIDQTHLQLTGGNFAFNQEKLAISALQHLVQSRDCPLPTAVLQGFIDRLIKCARLLAIVSIQDAANEGLNAKKIAEDMSFVTNGDNEIAAGRYENGIEDYRNAWRHALNLRLVLGLAANGRMQLRFISNNNNAPYLIEVSTNLVDWVPLGSCKADASGEAQFTDPDGNLQGTRFYRVRQ
jgi:PKD repeat protein